jgi:hypothetical protein
MATEHEYALLGGLNRSAVGRWLGLVAAGAASATVFITLAAIDLSQRFGWSPSVPPLVLWPLGAGFWYLVIYWLFDRHAWRLKPISALLQLPNLNGEWEVSGRSLNSDSQVVFEWSGIITIWQSWDKLKIRLKTSQSGSESIAAALLHDPTEGFRLLYHYRNLPRADQGELQSHRGFAEICFQHDCMAGEGEYFNGLGRATFGAMTLKRRQ